MPSGYTSGVADGTVTDLRSFALICARGMGALIMMRDEPINVPIPESFQPSDYHSRRLEESQAWVAELEAMSPDQVKASAEKWNEENEAYRIKLVAENNVRRHRYFSLIAQTEAWKGAPEGLKDFMLSQLRDSLRFDVSDDPLRYAPEAKTHAEWLSHELWEAKRRVQYHTFEHAKEVSRTEERNAWLAQLRAALPPLPDDMAEMERKERE